jgi:hypothetical protein
MPAALGILFPVPFNYLVVTISGPVNFDLLDFPGMGCVVGKSFYHVFWAKLLMYCLPVVILDIVSRVQVYRLRKSNLIEDNSGRHPVDSDGKPVNKKGGMVKWTLNDELPSWKKKIARTILIADIKSSMAGWRFAFIYLLYPSAPASCLYTHVA